MPLIISTSAPATEPTVLQPRNAAATVRQDFLSLNRLLDIQMRENPSNPSNENPLSGDPNQDELHILAQRLHEWFELVETPADTDDLLHQTSESDMTEAGYRGSRSDMEMGDIGKPNLSDLIASRIQFIRRRMRWLMRQRNQGGQQEAIYIAMSPTTQASLQDPTAKIEIHPKNVTLSDAILALRNRLDTLLS